MKTGRLGKEEQQYIADNVKHMSYIAIARYLDRSSDAVKNYIETKLGMQTQLTSEANPNIPSKSNLRDRQFWKGLEQQFTSSELDCFEEEWDNIQAQFKNDVLATEESQIIDVIKLSILMHRNLRNQKDALTTADELSESLKDSDEGPDFNKSFVIEQIAIQRAAQSSLTREYKDLQDQKNKLLSALKGTRADRIKKIDSARESFIAWMDEIVGNPEKRRELGIWMEKQRLAAIDEEVRLSAWHKYMGGDHELDKPLLSCDTVGEDDGIN